MQTARQMLADLERGATTSEALVRAAIAAIQARDGRLNAVVVRDFERAVIAARAADRRRARGGSAPLLGVPVLVKEGLDVEGLPTTWGLPGFEQPAAADAAAVARLKAAGAVVLGKTNVSTMLADWQAANPVYGVTRNPWDAARTCGGSSGGAAAVAAGFAPLDVGSDLSGSLRIPAAFCGVCSHRPSFGLIPTRGFAPPLAPRTPYAPVIDQAVLGPIARTADDLMLALDVLAGPDQPDSAAWRLDLPPAPGATPAEYRVLLIDAHPSCATAAAVRRALQEAGRRLQAAGAEVVTAVDGVPDLAELADLFQRLLMAQLAADDPADAGISHGAWVALDRRRAQLAGEWAAVFEQVDVVLCPAAPVTAFPHDERPFESRSLDIDGRREPYPALSVWSTVPTPAGLPATTVPIGLADGLPVGAQVIAGRYRDCTAIAVGGLLQALCAELMRP